MTPALIAALSAGIPAVIASIIALIQALKAKGTSTVAQGTAANAFNAVQQHLITKHDAFPIQPPTSPESAPMGMEPQ